MQPEIPTPRFCVYAAHYSLAMTCSTDAPLRASTFCCVLAFMLVPLLCLGQYHPKIRSDRLGQTIGPFSVGTGGLQHQFGAATWAPRMILKSNEDTMSRASSDLASARLSRSIPASTTPASRCAPWPTSALPTTAFSLPDCHDVTQTDRPPDKCRDTHRRSRCLTDKLAACAHTAVTR